MSYTITPLDYSIKLAITASIKRFEFKRYDVEPDQIIDALLTDIFADLFPQNPSLVSPNNIHPPVTLPSTTTTTTVQKERKKPGPKPKTTTTTEPAVESTTVAPTEKKKPGPKPKPKKIKFTKQHLNAMKEAEVEPEAFTNYLNEISPETFDANNMFTYLDDFVKSIKPKEKPEEGYKDLECIEVEFNGQTYSVNTATKAVYKANDEHVNVKVGYVGALEFADMEIPPEDEE